ncbi:MAG: cation:proton antiporter [Leptolyngbyaceae cyanobacterium MO_188.B28]|nr:cation:proton antiporter [Leptolyngbyaceae cyanobacterium MO_188.B28]
MPSFSNVFYEIAALLAVTSLAGALALWLRQPLIMAFIAVGVLVGAMGFDGGVASEQVNLFAELGITLLLFVVGLKLDPQEIRAVGPVAIVAGVGQISLTASLGYLIGLATGLRGAAVLYVAVALTFSSTIIVVKLLSDKREIDALHGRIALGVLIVQDITVVLVMIGLSAFGGEAYHPSLGQALLMFLIKGVAVLMIVSLSARYLLPRLLHSLARSPELLILFAITWAITLASLGEALGFSKEVGAFLAGVSLASTHYRATLGARLVGLRDFLLLFFFLDLGAHIDIGHLGSQLGPAVVFSIFVLVGKPLMIMGLVGAMGYRKHTGAHTSLALSQISEFSLILGALGVSLGHISEDVMGLITLIGLITIGLSTYLILYTSALYQRFSAWLTIFERNIPKREEALRDSAAAEPRVADVIIFGLGRYGGCILQDLRQYDLVVLGVDFDPVLVQYWRKRNFWTFYGDAEDPEFTNALPLSQAQWVVSTIPGRDISLTLLHSLKHHGFKGGVALTCHTLQDVDLLKQAGADLVLLPFRDAAEEAARKLAEPTRN